MKKLLLLTLILLSVSGFAQHKTEQSNPESEIIWTAVDDEISQWYDIGELSSTPQQDRNDLPGFVKKDVFISWVIFMIAVMIALYIIAVVLNFKNAATIYEKIEIMSRKNKDLKAQLFNLKVDLNEMIVPKPLYKKGETYGKYDIVDFGYINNKSHLTIGYRYDVRNTDTGKVYRDVLEEVLTWIIEA